MSNSNRPGGRVNLYDVVIDIAAELADTHSASWQKDGRDNELRRAVAMAINQHGVDSAAILPLIKRALENGDITALSTFNGLPSVDADEVVPTSGIWRSGVSDDGQPAPDVSVLREWFLTEDDAQTVRRRCGLQPTSPGLCVTPEAPKPVQRSQTQDQEILAVIRDRGYDPTSLPVAARGRPGVKAEIRKAIGNDGMWSGIRVFDKAWQRLRDNGEIADKT